MDKNVGFNRNILLPWLDAAAALCAEIDDPAELRARLERVVSQDIASPTNRRKAIDILIRTWVKSDKQAPELRREAVARFQATGAASQRIWLHFGLILLSYPFFRETAAAIGQLTRYQDEIMVASVKWRLVGQRGQLGSLGKAVERVLFSLRNWGILVGSERPHVYAPCRAALEAGSPELEGWLLACALQAHPAEELPFAELLRLPELFPFHFTLGVGQLRERAPFVVSRQGAAWDMVRVTA